MRTSILVLGLLAAVACDKPAERPALKGGTAPAVLSSPVPVATAAPGSTSCGAVGVEEPATGATLKAAYFAQQAELRLHVDALTCEGCAWQIREALGKEPGVRAVVASVKDKLVTVSIDPTLSSQARVTSILAGLGHAATEAP